jgi:hypothetical protein
VRVAVAKNPGAAAKPRGKFAGGAGGGTRGMALENPDAPSADKEKSMNEKDEANQ